MNRITFSSRGPLGKALQKLIEEKKLKIVELQMKKASCEGAIAELQELLNSLPKPKKQG